MSQVKKLVGFSEGGASCFHGCASDQFLSLIGHFAIVCLWVCSHACVLNTDFMPATPTREFLSGFDGGGGCDDE